MERHLHWKEVLVATFPARKARTLFPNNRLRILTRVDRHDWSRPCQQHDHDYYEIVLVRSGRATHSSLHGSKSISPGDVLILPPQTWHRYTTSELVVYNCCIGQEVFHQHLSFLHQDPFWSGFVSNASIARQSQWKGRFRVPRAKLGEVERHFQLLHHLTEQPFGFQTNYQLLGAIICMLGQLAEALRSQVRLEAPPPVLHPLVKQGIEHIERDIGRNWRLTELCTLLNGIHQAYFIRLFRSHVGLTPKAYIIHRRIEKAANRLLTTDDRVTEIAMDLGWNDPNLFSRTFRQFFNTSPSDYREARR